MRSPPFFDLNVHNFTNWPGSTGPLSAKHDRGFPLSRREPLFCETLAPRSAGERCVTDPVDGQGNENSERDH